MSQEQQILFPTNRWAQCRNEQPFPVTISCWKGKTLIDCPTCGRTYTQKGDNTWFSDRKLKFLSFPEEVEEARKTAIG